MTWEEFHAPPIPPTTEPAARANVRRQFREGTFTMMKAAFQLHGNAETDVWVLVHDHVKAQYVTYTSTDRPGWPIAAETVGKHHRPDIQLNPDLMNQLIKSGKRSIYFRPEKDAADPEVRAAAAAAKLKAKGLLDPEPWKAGQFGRAKKLDKIKMAAKVGKAAGERAKSCGKSLDAAKKGATAIATSKKATKKTSNKAPKKLPRKQLKKSSLRSDKEEEPISSRTRTSGGRIKKEY